MSKQALRRRNRPAKRPARSAKRCRQTAPIGQSTLAHPDNVAPRHRRLASRARALGYYALYLAPIGVAVSFNAAYAYWLVSGVAIATLVWWLWSASAWRRLVALLLNGASSLANFLLAASLYVQGTGFNTQFFYHLDGETFAIARQAFAPLFFGSWVYWLVLCLYPLSLPRALWMDRHRGTGRIAITALIGVFAYAPLASFLVHGYSRLDEERGATIVPKTPPPAIVASALAQPRDLVLIFAESMEATYSRREIFGNDLTPRLSALAMQGVRFDDMRQVEHTGSTIDGMVAALCAQPLRSPAAWANINSLLPNVDVPLSGELCLGDVLLAHGYRTVFLGGAPLAFAGKGAFLGAHGFQERHGRASLASRLSDPGDASGWGVRDDRLFAFADELLDEWTDDPKPFALTVLTLDTHHPSGLPSASCGKRPGAQGRMEFAVRCSDRLVADFIERVRTRFPDAVVALFSDHLAHRNDFARTLGANAGERRLRFAVWGPGIEPRGVHKAGTHFDVMPTLLDLLGFEQWLRHNFGASLLRFDSPWFALGPEAFPTVAHTLPAMRMNPGAQIVFEAKGPVIRVDGRRLLATHHGLSLDHAIFAIEFDSSGNVVGFGSSDTLDGFGPSERAHGESGAGRWLIGVSSNETFNRSFLPDADVKLTYFIGRFGAEDFIVRPLWWRETVDVPPAFDP